jgi:hypothetical protein
MVGRENGVAETIEENNCPRILKSYTKILSTNKQ